MGQEPSSQGGEATKFSFHPPSPVTHQIMLVPLSPCYSCPRWQHLRWPLSLSSLPLTSVFCLNELFLKFRSDHNIVLSSGLLVPFASLTAYRSKLNSRRGPHETPRSRAPLLSVQF